MTLLRAIIGSSLALGLAGLILPTMSLAQERDWPSRTNQDAIDAFPADPEMGRGGECRFEGERIEQGRSLCITVNGERLQAVCGMSLNNTAWRTSGPCTE